MTTTTTRTRKRPARRIGLTIRPEGRAVGAVDIAIGKAAASYQVTEVQADFGRGFLVEKIGDASAAYHVNAEGERRMCECLGFLRHAHCKHADGLAALIAAGRL
jgi:hypothetical protein